MKGLAAGRECKPRQQSTERGISIRKYTGFTWIYCSWRFQLCGANDGNRKSGHFTFCFRSELAQDPSRKMSVMLETSLGELVIDLEVERCPRTCENFLKLCKIKYYALNAFFNGLSIPLESVSSETRTDLIFSVERFHRTDRRSHSHRDRRRIPLLLLPFPLPILIPTTTPLLPPRDHKQAQAYCQRDSLDGCLSDRSTGLWESVLRHSSGWDRVSRWETCGLWACHRGTGDVG